jgi:single-strand DNA-binding protein
MNKLEMTGVLTRDNNFKVSDKGNAFLTNSISVTEGKDKKRTDYFNIVAFGDVAETITNNMKKGDTISFIGKLQNNNYEKDGVKVYRDQIIVNELIIKSKDVFKGKEVKVEDEEFPF